MAETPSRRSRRAFLGGLTAAAVAARSKTASAQMNNITSTTATGVHSAAAQGSAVAEGHVSTGATGRAAEALRIRQQAAELSAAVATPNHNANGDERSDLSYALSFTKGLPHDYRTGLVDRNADFERFVSACDSGDRAEFRELPLGPADGFRTADDQAKLRGWETPAAGLSFNLVGHDPQSLTLPPPPGVGSDELTAELAEVYAQAALRDQPLTMLRHDAGANPTRDRMLEALATLPWFDKATSYRGLSDAAAARRRSDPTPQTAFRGTSPGDTIGPYLSQLLLIGSPTDGRNSYDGIIEYGAQAIDQRVRQVGPTDFLTSWDEWFDVQNALAPARGEPSTGNRRFITTGRDLATYVHSDALYQPYLNACLVLLSNRFPLDPSLPYQQDDASDHQQGFVLYAAPHVLSMLVEVCSRALKTVLFQKFNVHRRIRPEALAARIEKADLLGIDEISDMAAVLNTLPVADEIRRITGSSSGTQSMLLPMAFAEGSPMHPSYGAGHATVAGACVTILKTFFDHTRPFATAGDPSTAYVPTTNGSQLATVNVLDSNGDAAGLTVEGELNKLAANISIGRNWAGVHYFSDYAESLRLGEQIAIEIMREHMLTVPETFKLRVPKFDGTRVWI